MSHVVLQRKYRPKCFSEVVGQDLITTALKSALLKGRIAHAFLFTGSRGIGKTTVARILAKALVCIDRKDVEPCNICHNCLGVDNFSSLDVMEIDGASHTSVDDIRQLRDNARFKPGTCRYRIYIIDEVHMLSISAFNALLKILEEPPEHVIFIFATTESHKIPKTILSRCQRYDFKRVSEQTIFLNLKDVLAKEDLSISDDGLKLLAKAADGSLRDAQSLCEQILVLGKKSYTEDEVSEILGMISQKLIKDLASFIIAHEVEKSLFLLKEVYDRGFDLSDLLDGLLEHFRLLALASHLELSQIKKIESIDEDVFLYAQSLDKNDLKRLFSMALKAKTEIFYALSPLFSMEYLILELALRPPLKEAYQISQTLSRLEKLMQNRALPIKEKGSNFSKLLAKLAKDLPLAESILRLARVVEDNNNCLIKLYFDKEFHLNEIKRYEKDPTLLLAIKDIYNRDYSLEFLLNKEAIIKQIPTTNEKEKAELLLETNDNPIIKEALKIFGGSIVNVSRLKPHDIT